MPESPASAEKDTPCIHPSVRVVFAPPGGRWACATCGEPFHPITECAAYLNLVTRVVSAVPDVTAEAVVALRLAADNMPLARPGQPWEGAAEWLHSRADAFEAALAVAARHGTPPEAACGLTFSHDWHGYLDDEGSTRVCDGEPCFLPPAEGDR